MKEKIKKVKKKRPLFIKADLYSVAEIVFLLAVALFVVASKGNAGSERNRRWILASGFAIPTICCIAQFFFGKAKVNNRSGADIEYLNETESGNRPSYTLPNGEKQYDIDGIRCNGIVYKVPDGVHLTVNRKGTVVPHSIVGGFLFYIEGGVLDSPPDDSWEPLFKD